MRPTALSAAAAPLFAAATLAAVVFAAGAAGAQPAAPSVLQFASSSQVQALVAKARATVKPGQTNLVQPIIGVAPFAANLEYRTGPAGGGTHEKEDELFYVVDGSGTFVTGGRLVPAPGPNPANPAVPNTTIEGGQAKPIAKGDLMIVPHGTPHQVTAVNGELILISMHLPRG
jgi:mannose-6-phosphate isomerase-like protein (cupin superfamily)